MGLSSDKLKVNGCKVAVERKESTVVEQAPDNYIKHSRTIVLEQYSPKVKHPVSKRFSLKERNNKFPVTAAKKLSLGKFKGYCDKHITSANNIEKEIELYLETVIKNNSTQEIPYIESIQAAYERLDHLEASINNEINNLKQQQSTLNMNRTEQMDRKIERNINKAEAKRIGIAQEKFSNKHLFVCTSPRYGDVEELSCRPYKRSVASQMETVTKPIIKDCGAVGDHKSLNNIKKELLEGSSKNAETLNNLKNFVTAPPGVQKLDHYKVNDCIVNYCYCHNNVVNPAQCCNQCYNNNQGMNTTSNYCYNECYQTGPCSSPNYCYITTTAAQPTQRACRCSTIKSTAANCSRRRTDLDTEHFYSRSSSPNSKHNDKCGKYDRTIKVQLEKELKAQFKSAREKERYKIRHKEPCGKLRKEERCEKKIHDQEKKRYHSADRKFNSPELCKKVCEGTSKLIKLLDRYCDEKCGHKKKNVSASDKCKTGRNCEGICQITLKKCKPRRNGNLDSPPQTVNLTKDHCQEYCIEKIECFNKKSSKEPQCTLEALDMLKKMRITEYKPTKPKSPQMKLCENHKEKQYLDYINKYKKQAADIKSKGTERKSFNKVERNKANKKGYQELNYYETIVDSDCNSQDVKDYQKFRTEMDMHLASSSSPNDCTTDIDSTHTYTRCRGIRRTIEDKEIQTCCTAGNSINSPIKAKKALVSVNDFLNTYVKTCSNKDKDFLDLQAKAADVVSKLAVFKEPEVKKKLQTCETQTEVKTCNSTCAGVQTTCQNINEEQQQQQTTEFDLNLIIEEPPPLSHTTYEEEYYCLPMPKYVSADLCDKSYCSYECKDICEKQSAAQKRISCNRNSVSPRSITPCNNRSYIIGGYNNSCSEAINRLVPSSQGTNFLDCATSTPRVKANENKNFENMQNTLTPRSPCPSTSQLVTPCENEKYFDEKYYPCASALTMSRDNSLDKSKRCNSPNRCSFKSNDNNHLTPRTNMEGTPPLRGILKLSHHIDQTNFTKYNDHDRQNETITTCMDKDNAPNKTPDLISQSSFISDCTGNLPNNSNILHQPQSCVKSHCDTHMAIKSEHFSPIPTFNNCPCLQNVYCDILQIYCMTKQRNRRSCQHNNT